MYLISVNCCAYPLSVLIHFYRLVNLNRKCLFSLRFPLIIWSVYQCDYWRLSDIVGNLHWDESSKGNFLIMLLLSLTNNTLQVGMRFSIKLLFMFVYDKCMCL